MSLTVVDDKHADVVPVVTGSSADGYVEVTPRGSTLTEGSRVVVGRREQP